ncbi:GNAT family protein (plasmid) [Tistrella mobilis]|uniref:GNAT family N-acetyltransferase n=1 Tax=Tistrella mobilis TaxID=171437 RepID=UPI0035583C2F
MSRPGHPDIRTDGLFLRPPCEADLEMMRGWRNADGVRQMFRGTALISAAEQRHWYAAWCRRTDDLMWIALDDAGTPLGQGALYDIDPAAGTAEAGRFIAAPAIRGTGRFGAVCRAITGFGFDVLGLVRLRLEVRPENAVARRFYVGQGFRDAGVSADGFVVMALDRPEGTR